MSARRAGTRRSNWRWTATSWPRRRKPRNSPRPTIVLGKAPVLRPGFSDGVSSANLMAEGPVPENTVVFLNEMHISDIRDVERYISWLIEFRGFEHIFLDFKGCRTLFSESMIPIVCYVLERRQEGVTFSLRLPEFEKLRRLFLNC